MSNGGYFSAPSDELDPDIFDGNIMKEDVRTGLLNLLYSDLENDVGLNEPWNWTQAWVAGSGASYQWGNGDLDVLFGVDLPEFLRDNPHFPRLSERETAAYIDKTLKSKSWPKTRNVSIGGSKKRYEITFFWNPGVSTDITVIHPYAAYNITNDGWSVSPEADIPLHPREAFPAEWFDWTDHDAKVARGITETYGSGSPSAKIHAVNAARSLWQDIHEGRKRAFSDIGLGYGDWNNFRWQRAKDTGTVDILRNLLDTDAEPEESPGDIITRAAMRYATPRYWT